MPIKILGKYIFSDSDIILMETMLKNTKSTGYECAGRICANKDCISNVKITNIQIGNESCVEVPKRCDAGKISIEVIHTHAPDRGKCILSLPDMQNHILSNNVIDCIGAEDKVLCFTRKKVANFKKNLNMDIANARWQVQSMIMNDENVADYEINRLRSKLAEKLNEKYFNVIRLI